MLNVTIGTTAVHMCCQVRFYSDNPPDDLKISVATAMRLDQLSVDYLVLRSNNQDRKVSGKSMSMRGKTFKAVIENCS